MRKRTHSIEDGYWLLKQYPCSHATAEGPSPLFSHFIIRTSRRFKFQVIRRRLEGSVLRVYVKALYSYVHTYLLGFVFRRKNVSYPCQVP